MKKKKKSLVIILMLLILMISIFDSNAVFALGYDNMSYNDTISAVKKEFSKGNTTMADDEAKEIILSSIKKYYNVDDQIAQQIVDEASENKLNFTIRIEYDATGGTTKTLYPNISKESKEKYQAKNDNPFGGESIDATETDTADEAADQLGGILLRPIFALVNYIADSVMRVTGEIMYPEAYNSETGDRADIMTAGNAVDLGYKKSTKVEVDVSNFKALSKKYYPQFRYTPEEIFSGQVNILSIDFISGKDSDGNTINNTGWTELRKVIAGWYKALRLIAAIGLLSVLIYTGFKIIMSSSA